MPFNIHVTQYVVRSLFAHNLSQTGLWLTLERCIAVPVDSGEHARTDVQTLWSLDPHKHA